VSGVLITGDALFNFLGMRLAYRMLCNNVRLTAQTVHTLGEVDYDVVAFTHGPQITDRARERVRNYLRNLH
jgi:hypothetical protein